MTTHPHHLTGQPCSCGFDWTKYDTPVLGKTAGKLHDFLMNPKSRPDLQTPKAQMFLKELERRFHNDKTDALMPWLTREWKKGRLADVWLEDALADHPVARALPSALKDVMRAHHEGRPYEPQAEVDIPGLYNAIAADTRRRSLFYTAPNGRHDAPLHPTNVDHWGDFLRSNHPHRRQLGDIMAPDNTITAFQQRVHDWDAAMEAEATAKALAGGEVVHQYPDNWTVKKLTTPEELKGEGNAMGHCVGGYGSAVQSGRSLIYSLRDPEGHPHVTTEIYPQRWQDPPGPNGEPGRIWGEGEGAGHQNPEMQMTPVPHGGSVSQIQGKGNREPIDEYKARMADWFRSFPPEDRPQSPDGDGEAPALYDDSGYSHYRLDEPGLIPEWERLNGGLVSKGEPTEDEYGLIRQPYQMDADYDDLLTNIQMHDYGSQGSAPNTDHIDDIHRLAKERGEIPQLGEALGGYQQTQQEDFDDWMHNNYEYAPRYPDEPHGYEDEDGNDVDEGEGRPYWDPRGSYYGERVYDQDEAEKEYNDAMAQWESEHAGMQAVNRMYNHMNPHYGTHPETGEQGFWNELPLPQQPELPQQPQDPQQLPPATSKVQKTHPHIVTGLPCSCSFGRLAAKGKLAKTAGKIEWLLNREDKFSQTPEGQRALGFLQSQAERNPAVDDLAPWLYREAKKGRLTIGDQTFYVKSDDGLQQITPPLLDHWADWFNSKSPTRRGVDIMQLDAPGVIGKVDEWNEEMRKKMEDARAKEGSGQIVHRFDGSDGDQGWTVRRLRNADEAREEGNQMGHCVGSYGHSIENGSSQIFSLRDEKNGPHATMEISPENAAPPAADYEIPMHVWDEVPHHGGVPINRLRELHEADVTRGQYHNDQAPRSDDEQIALDNFRYAHGHVPLTGGKVVQTQGKSNQTPNPEYTAMLDRWLEPHDLQSFKPWWDEYYTQDGPEDFEQLLGHNGEYEADHFGYRYPAEHWYDNEPENYRWACSDAEENGLDAPALYHTDPNYEKILESLIDPKAGYGTTSRDQPPWRGYNPAAGQYVYDYAKRDDHYVANGDGRPQFREGEEEGEGPEWQRYQTRNHLDDLKDALQDHMEYHKPDPWPGSEEDYDHIINPFERQEAINKDKREYYANEYGDESPWFEMFDHLGPLLHPGYQPMGNFQAPAQLHPDQQQMFKQTDPDQQYFYPQYQSQLPGDGMFTYGKVAHTPLYYRWAFSPTSGKVELSSNSEAHPLDVAYHSDLARRINEPDLVHGYASPIGGGWRVTDWDSDPVEDQNIVAQVMRALHGEKAAKTARAGSWGEAQEDWSRCHHSLPT